MKKRKQWPLLLILLAIVSCSGLWGLPAMASVDNSGVLQDVPPKDDANGHYEPIKGAALSDKTKLDLWHYSGGYWKVTNLGSEAITVPDKQMGAGDKLVIPASDAKFALELPATVKEQIAAGKKVVPVIQSGSGAKLDELFQLPGTFTMNRNTLTFSVRPKFNLIKTGQLSFEDPYKLKIPITVPFIDPKYGYNMYSVFGNGYKAVQVNGWVNPSDPMNPGGRPSGWIHPSMIADTKGVIKSGYQLMINSKLMDSAGFTVGEGTFANAGALGLCFEYPVQFTFYVYDPTPTPEPPDPTPDPTPPEKIICQKCGQCELTEAGVCTKRICEDFGTPECGCYVPPEVKAQAILALPTHTYEGHPVTAVDKSHFTVDGERFSADRAYAEKYADNSFHIVESGAGTIRRSPDKQTEAVAVFPRKGSYNVKLRVTPTGGSSLYDTKPIEVRKTPTVVASLGGTQKQNRKQTLDIRVATNPDNPLETLYVELTHKETGGKVRLTHNLDGRENQLINTDMIKTRAIIGESSDEYWTNCRLEFLTKNTYTTDFTYKVYARDSRGLWDEVTVDFTASPDQPPRAAIDVSPSFIRETGKNDAVIKMEDASTTDGDQLQRVWSVRNTAGYNGTSDVFTSPASIDPFEGAVFVKAAEKPGYEDNSFGTGKAVQFQRTGVGKIQLKLDVKDVWTEETLAEYITDADYLTASALAVTEVMNVAPMVSMEPIHSRTAEILLLAGGEAEYRTLKNSAAELNTRLLENAVDASITVEKMSPTPGSSITYSAEGSARVNYGFDFNNTGFWESGSWLIDEHRLYKAEATWVKDEAGDRSYIRMPYTIYAYDAAGENDLPPVWSCRITEGLIGPVADKGAGAFLAQDLDNRYLYVYAGTKTIIIDKQNGAILAALPYKIGKISSVSGTYIYTYQPDGIYRISLSNAAVKQVYSFRITADADSVRRIEGKDHFLITSGTTINRGIFDPRTEELTMERLYGTESDDGRTRYRLAAIDTAGNMLISCVTPEGGKDDPASLQIRAYGADNGLLKTVSTSIDAPYHDYVVPIYDAGGQFHYFGLTSAVNGSKYKSVAAHVYGVDSDYGATAEARERKENGYPTKADQILMGMEHGDGNLYIMTGGQYLYLDTNKYAGASEGMGERTRAFYFKPDGAAGECANLSGGVWSGMNQNAEYATRSDAYIAVSTGDNNKNGGRHTTDIVRWGQSIDQILLRYINRGVSGAKDLSAVVVLDNTNKADADNGAAIAHALKEKRSQFLFSTTNSRTAYGATIVGAAGAMGQMVSADQLTESIVNALLKEEGAESSILQLKTTAETGRAERTYRLAPGVEYFYEYDYRDLSGEKERDMVTLTGNYTRPIPQSGLLADKYVVTHSFEEDFNDSETNPFFRLEEGRVVNGQYRGTYGKGRVSNNSFHSDESSLSFTVPEGKQAVVSWDYDINRESDTDWNVGYYVDDVLWKNLITKSAAKGHYTHLDLLGSGKHTIRFFCGEYGKSYEFWTLLDNLHINLVELKSNPALTDEIDASASVSGDGSWNRVQGVFQTPDSVAAYSAMPSTYEKSDLERDYGRFYQWISREWGDSQLDVRANSALYAGISFRLKANSNRNAAVKVGPYEFTSRSRWEDYYALYDIDGDFTAGFRDYGTTIRCAAQFSTWNAPTAYFTGLEVLSGNRNTLTNQNRYFAAPQSSGVKGLFVENDRYDGTVKFAFAPGKTGEYQLRNLRLYSIQNGVRVYVDNSSLGGGDTVKNWSATDAQIAVIQTAAPEEDEQKLIYQKGELVSYKVNYFDYETDPSKKQFWRYTHTPFNDGPHPDAAVILDENGQVVSMSGKVLDRSIDRFYVDGKYTVEHWQEDNTARGKNPGGNPDYDKASNVCSLTFYIQGGGAAPWITHIETIPGKVKEEDRYKLRISVDDMEKDVLRLTTEVYFEGKLIYTHKKENITADPVTKKYPAVITDTAPLKAKAGRYEVICTVRDWSGVGLGTCKFTVVSEGRIEGEVMHTELWEQNRKHYNMERFGTEYNKCIAFDQYKKEKAPRKRGGNVFWSGEEFVLEAAVAGKPKSVTCQIVGQGYSTRMSSTGRINQSKETIYAGTLWKSDMLHKWGRPEPEELTFRFTARYENGAEKIHEATIILDNYEEYWQLHRFS